MIEGIYMNKKNKTVFLISPSGYTTKKNLENAKDILRRIGLEPIYLPDITSRYKYYAGDYKRRLNEINFAYSDKNSRIIFITTGGLGAVQTILFLDYDMIKKSNKVLIGYSDATILLNSIYKKCKTSCFHGPNLNKPFKEFDKKTISCLIDALNRRNYSVVFKEKDIIKNGFAKSQIIGGNLSLLERSLGTEFEIETEEKILFIEDVRMKEGYVLDILWHLKIAGKFNNVKGIILGRFTDCGKNINFYLSEFFKDFEVPVIMNQPIGHGEPNLTIPLGEICIIDTKRKLWKIIFSTKQQTLNNLFIKI